MGESEEKREREGEREGEREEEGHDRGCPKYRKFGLNVVRIFSRFV